MSTISAVEPGVSLEDAWRAREAYEADRAEQEEAQAANDQYLREHEAKPAAIATRSRTCFLVIFATADAQAMGQRTDPRSPGTSQACSRLACRESPPRSASVRRRRRESHGRAVGPSMCPRVSGSPDRLRTGRRPPPLERTRPIGAIGGPRYRATYAKLRERQWPHARLPSATDLRHTPHFFWT